MTDFELKMQDSITVETISKTILDETAKWGFKPSDYMSLVNGLLDLSLINPPQNDSKEITGEKPQRSKLKFPLQSKQVQIRLLNKDTDYTIVQDWLKDEAGRWFLLSRSSSSSKTLQELLEDKRNIFGIISLPDSTPIGLMGFLNYDQNNHKAEMRKLIGAEIHRGKGYAKEATMLWIQYGINNLGLKKIYLNTIENNIRNLTLNKELGFQIEGILRKEFIINNEYYDVIRMGYIVED
ncbi:MAG: GNAT family protein [Ignavibacteriaceae bacterium]|nr:GNAT family protein [Ignavibacteriaceae bacterium]